MRKLLDWEKTVEAQRKKQFWLWSLALVGWAAALAAVWWIEDTLYGDIIDTGIFSFLGASIGVPIGLGLRKAMGKEEKPLSMYACNLLLVSVLLVAGALTGTKIMGLTSTYGAKKNIGAEGFTDVEYLGWMYGDWVYEYAVEKDFYEESMAREKYYMLFGRKDGAPWRFVVDPKGGKIMIAATEGDEPELGNWYRSRETGE